MKKYLILFFVLGIIFKLWFASLVPQPFVFDQTEYHTFALQILEKGLVAWQSRLYGYPLLLAGIYKIFGVGNFGAVAIVQSVFDCLSAVLIFLTAKKIFKNTKAAWMGYLLYLFNPFTAVFVILTLSEIWGIFLLTLITYLLTLINSSRTGPVPRVSQSRSSTASRNEVYLLHNLFLARKMKLALGPLARATRSFGLFFLIALLLGFLPQVRPAFLFYGLAILVWLLIRELKERRVVRGLGMLILFILPFTYNLAGNWVYFHQFAPTTVDNLFVREFYISLYVPDRSPFHAKSSDVFPPQVQKLYNEFTPVPQNGPQRRLMAQKYLSLGLSEVAGNPSGFITSRLAKFWYVWEKHFLFYYTQPENKMADFATYWGNNLLLLAALSGFILWFKKGIKLKENFFGWLFVFTVVYISAVHSISLAEERYSLPGYPLIFLFAGYGIYKFACSLDTEFFRHEQSS